LCGVLHGPNKLSRLTAGGFQTKQKTEFRNQEEMGTPPPHENRCSRTCHRDNCCRDRRNAFPHQSQAAFVQEILLSSIFRLCFGIERIFPVFAACPFPNIAAHIWFHKDCVLWKQPTALVLPMIMLLFTFSGRNHFPMETPLHLILACGTHSASLGSVTISFRQIDPAKDLSMA
jgi:hypothetical protein